MIDDQKVGRAEVELHLDTAPARAELSSLVADTKARLAEINAMHADPKVDVDVSKVKAQVTGLLGYLSTLEKKLTKLPIDADTGPLDRGIAAAKAKLEFFKKPIALQLDLATAKAKLEAQLAEIDRKRAHIQVELDVDPKSQKRLGDINREILRKRIVQIDYELRGDKDGIKQAQGEIKELTQAQLARQIAISKERERLDVEKARADLADRTARAEADNAKATEAAELADQNRYRDGLVQAEKRISLQKQLNDELSKTSKNKTQLDDDQSTIKIARIKDELRTKFGVIDVPIEPKADLGALARVKAEYEAAFASSGTGPGGRFRTPLPWFLRWAQPGGGDGGDESIKRRLLFGKGALGLAGVGTLGGFAGLSAERLLFTAGSVIGSGAAGIAGGGLLAAGAAGNIAVGGGSDLAVIKSTIADTKQLAEANAKVSKAQEVFGPKSQQANIAEKNRSVLQKELAGGPKTEGVVAETKLANEANKLNHFWDQQTQLARVNASKILEQVVGLGHRFVPLVANAARQNLGIIQKDIKPLFDFLESKTGGVKIFGDLERKFKSLLPTSVHAFTQAIELLLKTIDVASKFTGGFITTLDKFFTKWNEPGHFKVWEKEIGKLINDFHLWSKFFKLLGEDIGLIFKNDAGLGNSIIGTLTQMLEHVHAFLKSTEGSAQVHNIFAVHKEEVLALIKLLPLVLDPLGKIYLAVAPALVTAFTSILKVIASVLTGITELGGVATKVLGGALIGWKLGLIAPAFKVIKTEIKGAADELAKYAAIKLEGKIPGAKKLGGLFTSEASTSGAQFGEVAAERLLAVAPEMGNIIAERARLGTGGIPTVVTPRGPKGGGVPEVLPLSFGAKLLGRGLGAASIGLGGLLASEIAGEAIGGKTGSAISSIGNTASLGAGAGFLAGGPGGAAIGGLAAGVYALAKSLEKEGNTVKPKSSSPISQGVEREEIKELKAHHLGDNQQAFEILRRDSPAKNFYAFRTGANEADSATIQLSKSLAGASEQFQQAHLRIARANEVLAHAKKGTLEYKEALLAQRGAVNQAREAEEQWNKVRHDTESLADLAVYRAKTANDYAKQNVEGHRAEVKEKEEQGKVSLKELEELAAAEKSYAESRRKVHEDEARQAAVPLNIKRGEELKGPLEGAGEVALGRLALKPETQKIAMHVALSFPDANEAGRVAKAAIDAIAQRIDPHIVMKVLADTNDAKVAVVALRDLAKGATKDQVFKILLDSKSAKEKLKELEKLGTEAGNNTSKNYKPNLVPGINTAISNAQKALADGLHKINAQMKSALETIGLSPADAQSLTTGKPSGKLPGSGVTQFGQPGSKAEKSIEPFAAKGKLVQFGRAGDRGHDKIPAHLMVGSGEVGAVFTHHQQKVANHYLAPVGGLPGLFNKFDKPHYAATGGFFPGPQGRIDQGVDFEGPGPVRALQAGTVRRLGLWPGWPGTGGIVYSTPSGNMYVMENFTPARNLRVGSPLHQGQVIGRDDGGKFGIEAGFANAAGTEPLVPYTPQQAAIDRAGGTAPTAGGKSFAAFIGGKIVASIAKHIKPPHLGLPGSLGAFAQGAINNITKGANRVIDRATANFDFSGVGGHGGSHKANEALGRAMMLAAGWGPAQWPALQALWTQESGWDANSVNKSSGAYGIPQSLGHGHPFNLGDARAQIAWGLKYIKERYGSPGAAEAHERANNWYARGGLIKKPALLVGEHEHEWVINPHRPDNHKYLKEAGEQMGYHVTPAAGGKKPKTFLHPGPNQITSGKELFQLPDFVAARGIPSEILAPYVRELRTALKDEETNWVTVAKQKDKEVAKLKHSKSVAARAIAEAQDEAPVLNAKARAHESESKAKSTLSVAEARHAENSAHEEKTPEGEARLHESARSVGTAKLKLEQTEHGNARHIKDLEHKHKKKLSKVKATHKEHLDEIEKKLKHLKEGLHIIQYGGGHTHGVWEHTKYEAWKNLEKNISQGEKLERELKDKEIHITDLNKTVGHETSTLNALASRFKLAKQRKEPGEMAQFEKEWNTLFATREVKRHELGKLLKSSETSAKKFATEHPKLDIQAYIEGIGPEVERVETEDIAAGGEALSGVSGEAAATPTAELFVEKQGKKDQFEKLTETFALAQTNITPDNPVTPLNEELPGLEGEKAPAAELLGFWTSLLAEAKTAEQPASVITELANDVTGARSTYFGLTNSIEAAKKAQTSQQLQELIAYGSAREELYKQFGSNFAPITKQPPAILGGAQARTSAQIQAPTAAPVTHVNVTNHFAEGPANTHHWATGLAWELEAAI